MGDGHEAALTRVRATAVAVLAAMALAAGCGDEGGEADPDAAAVSATIRAAAGAIADEDPRRACAKLTARARREVSSRSGRGCERAVRDLTKRLPGPGFAALRRIVVRDVRVRGSRASALAEPPSDLVELARAGGVTQPLTARIELVRAGDGWLIDEATPLKG